MGEEDLWHLLSTVDYQTTTIRLMPRLLEKGYTALSSLKKIAKLSYSEWEPNGYLRNVLLPWYRPTDLGAGQWYDYKAVPWRIEEWCTAYRNRDALDEGVVSKVTALIQLGRSVGWEEFNNYGPSLVVSDTSLEVSIMIDGCKRACASWLEGVPRPVLCLASKYAAMLYPAEFFNAAVRKWE